MFDLIRELCKCIAVMNHDGLDRLVTLAKDITCNKNFRKADSDLTPTQFTRQVDQVLAMVNRGNAKEQGECKSM